MTRDDLAVVSRMFACWAAEDLEGLIACSDPGLEWHGAADGRLYKGHAGVREFFARWQNGSDRLEVPLQRAVELAPGRILAVGRLRVIRPGRGLADSPGVWAVHVEGGRITFAQGHRSERDAIDALQGARTVSAAG